MVDPREIWPLPVTPTSRSRRLDSGVTKAPSPHCTLQELLGQELMQSKDSHGGVVALPLYKICWPLSLHQRLDRVRRLLELNIYMPRATTLGRALRVTVLRVATPTVMGSRLTGHGMHISNTKNVSSVLENNPNNPMRQVRLMVPDEDALIHLVHIDRTALVVECSFLTRVGRGAKKGTYALLVLVGIVPREGCIKKQKPMDDGLSPRLVPIGE